MSVKTTIFVVSILILAFVPADVFYFGNSYKNLSVHKFIIGDKTIVLSMADTETERLAGLSGKRSLSLGKGLLLVYDDIGKHGIWMKNMKFPLDILWLDENYTVVDIAKNISPDTYPLVFGPNSPVLYVLEVSAGLADDYNIKVGDKFIYE